MIELLGHCQQGTPLLTFAAHGRRAGAGEQGRVQDAGRRGLVGRLRHRRFTVFGQLPLQRLNGCRVELGRHRTARKVEQRLLRHGLMHRGKTAAVEARQGLPQLFKQALDLFALGQVAGRPGLGVGAVPIQLDDTCQQAHGIGPARPLPGAQPHPL